MKRVIDLTSEEAWSHFMKSSSYFNSALPQYLSFEPVLAKVATILKGGNFQQFQCKNPGLLPNVNYNLITNKDGRFAWRPLELIHPAIYVSLVNTICQETSWKEITKRFKDFEKNTVECCSIQVMSEDNQTDVAAQVQSWWQRVEQRSLTYSLEYSHVLQTDITDCYGALYTHSIAWAIHGLKVSKENRGQNSLLGDKIDAHIQAGRYGQTNGIAQGSVLMDFIAELVLGYVDEQITDALGQCTDIRILRYRDDFRVFANSDNRAEEVLKIISDKLRPVGMKLGVAKTVAFTNVVEGSIKPDKLAGIELQDLGESNAKTIQKKLLRLHTFGQRFTNSGALRRLVSEFYTNIMSRNEPPDDLEVQVAIATDIAFVSPATIPAIAGILSHLISLAPTKDKASLWTKVRSKMARVPHNGYLEIWLQRVTRPKAVGIKSESDEPICQIVNGKMAQLWEEEWISNVELQDALDVSKIVVADADQVKEVVQPDEVELFKENAWAY